MIKIKTIKYVFILITIMAMILALNITHAAIYKTSKAEGAINIINLNLLENEVKANLDKSVFGYIRGGAEDENNLRINAESFDKKYIMPRVLQNIDPMDIDLSTHFLGLHLKTPIIQSPMASHGLVHEEGEIAMARGMAKAGSIFSLGTYGNKTIEEIAKVSGDNPFFFQFYMNKIDAFNEFTLNMAKRNGAKAIILTVDATVLGYREEVIKNNFHNPLTFATLALFTKYHPNDGSKKNHNAFVDSIYEQPKQAMTPDDIKYVKKISALPVIVKGIQSPEDADIAIKAGADGIWVSNHGGRQLDSGPASFDVLPAIANVVNKRVPIVFDGGVRRGSHVFKALASSADIVAVGRPILYGLNLGGSEGVNSVIQHLNKELTINMLLVGTKNIEDVKNTKLFTDKDIQ